MPIIGTTPDMIDAAEDRERFQKLLHDLGLRQPPMPRRAPKPRPWKGRRPGLPWWCAPATCWAAAPWKSCTSSATWSATCAKPSRSNDSPGAAGPLPERRHRVRRGLHARRPGATFIGGVMEHIEQAGVHAATRPARCPVHLSPEPVAELKRQSAAMAGP